MRYIFLSLLCFRSLVHTAAAQSADEKAILQILTDQTVSWNNNDLDSFMKGYWNSDSLAFIGKTGVTYGYQNILNNYKTNYGSEEKRGKLAFEILQVKRLSPEYFSVIGKWMLTRAAGNTSGHYTLLFRKMNGKWQIVSDHSS